MLDKVFISAPFAKVTETPDGGREVWGFATLERVDKAGEIADFDGTVKAFEKWSGEVSARTGGKNLGNVRLMHQPVAVGKTIHWEPTETAIKKDDGTEEAVKAIWVGAYVPPTKPEVIKDIDEGILSAFSIGGSYAKRWWDETSKAFRYVPELSEYSLVDNPAVPGADIINVISKGAGPWDKSERNLGGENVGVEGELQKKKPAGSYEDIRGRVSAACEEKFKGPMKNYWDGYTVATFTDKVIVYDYSQGKYFEVPYEDKNNTITLGDPTEVEQTYVPVSAQKMIEAELEKRAKKKKDELKSAAEERAKKYGISFKEGKGHLTPPKDYPTDEADYGDPVNYAYPIDSSRIQAAVSYFNHKGQMEAGGYTSEEWAKIGKRIATRAGEGHSYKDGKIETPSTEKKKGSEKALTPEELAKAAEVAGLTMDQVQAFFKALTPIDQAPAPIDVTTVDGDGDKDNNKEFPNPPEGSQKINIEAGMKSVEDSERESTAKVMLGDMAKSIDDLTKAGKSISAKNMVHLTHAQNHIKAAMDGTEYGPEHHLEVEGLKPDKKTDTGAEAPEVTEKMIASALEKSAGVLFSGELNKAVGKMEALVKGLASADTLTKTMERLGAVEKMVKEIHETPQPAGVVLNGGSPDIARVLGKGVAPADMIQIEDQVLENLVKSTPDAMVKDRISQELAHRRAKQIFKTGGNQ